ncbi:MAG: imidazole glycerol phosphate synthase subunit HisH [Lachnospiraceae bacterium]|nr:imidazole glycerol phosphate synthase subunit HisH [Lachnospiraceae bacterium]
MVTIIDYDAGNIMSVANAVRYLGEEVRLSKDPAEILSAERLILPGVGAFGDAMGRLQAFGLDQTIREAVGRGIPLLGICLGMQLLFDESEESPGVQGLGLLRGKILRIPDGDGRKVPQIGWNDLTWNANGGGRLMQGVPEHSYVYFVHSYYLQAEDPSIVTATTDYGVQIHAAVEKEQLCACQFHPEKSAETGLAMLRNFLRFQKEVPVC